MLSDVDGEVFPCPITCSLRRTRSFIFTAHDKHKVIRVLKNAENYYFVIHVFNSELASYVSHGGNVRLLVVTWPQPGSYHCTNCDAVQAD